MPSRAKVEIRDKWLGIIQCTMQTAMVTYIAAGHCFRESHKGFFCWFLVGKSNILCRVYIGIVFLNFLVSPDS